MAGGDVAAVHFETADEWAAWLQTEHARSDGIWLKFAKKDGLKPSLSYAEAVEVALCFGWIDSQARGLDDKYWLQRYTPRRARSKWSKINTERAEALIAAGRMQLAGLREVERARADGRWDAAYAGPRAITVPDDFAQALAANQAAAAFFETISGQNRYAILYRISSVKRPETRAKKVAQFVEMLAEHKTLYPPRGGG